MLTQVAGGAFGGARTRVSGLSTPELRLARAASSKRLAARIMRPDYKTDQRVRPSGHGKCSRMGDRGQLIQGGANSDNPKKVLFVCTANVCRSPMAEAIFNALAEERGLAWRAESAGVATLVDEDITPNARAALEEVGIYAGEHRARQVGEAMLKGADLVLVMGPRHVATLRRHFGGLSERVYTLPEYALGASPEEGIPDPYGQTMTAFRASVRQLLEYTEGLVGRLEWEGKLL